MARPGLEALLADVASGKVDVIVIYKIDRLTRRLADFARIVELLDKHYLGPSTTRCSSADKPTQLKTWILRRREKGVKSQPIGNTTLSLRGYGDSRRHYLAEIRRFR